jgi:hypothetical protein
MRALNINIDQFGSREPKRTKPGTLCRKSMTSMLTSDGEEHRKLLLGGIDHGEDTLDVVRRVTVTSSTHITIRAVRAEAMESTTHLTFETPKICPPTLPLKSATTTGVVSSNSGGVWVGQRTSIRNGMRTRRR